MSDVATPRLPGFGTVFAEQLRVVGLAVRREATVLLAGLAVVSALVWIDMLDAQGSMDGMPMPPVMMIVFGALAPFAVWKDERPFDGAHLWTLPVERRRHALTKVLAGGVWLLVAVAALQIWLLGLALATGGDLVEQQTRMLVRPGGLSDLVPVPWTPQPWQWASPFTTAVTCYLIGSAFMLGVKYPLRWGTLAVVAFVGFGILSEEVLPPGPPERLFEWIVEGPVGIDPATVGGGDAQETETLTGGRDFIGPEVLVIWRRLPSFEQWAPAALAWLGLGAIAVSVAAWRHRER